MNNRSKKSVPARQATSADVPVLNKKSQRLLDKLLADSHAGKNMVGPFYTAAEMIKSLNS